MKVAARNLEASGLTSEQVFDRVLECLSGGMVLLHHKVHAGRGIGAKVAESWILLKPVIVDGIIVRLKEDEDTAAANKVGRHVYGLRPSDIDRQALQSICPDVFWLGPVGAQRVAQRDWKRPGDLWTATRPSTINHVPSFRETEEGEIGVGTDPLVALARLSKGDGAGAIAALLDGLHLVDSAITVDVAGRRTEKRIWKPLRPAVDLDGMPIAYEADSRTIRHTTNAGRTGFSPKTFAAVSPLLVEAGYDPRDGALGHSYRLSDDWIAPARDTIGWVAETEEAQGLAEGAPTFLDEEPLRAQPTLRESAILDMVAGAVGDAGDLPSHGEVALTIARHVHGQRRLASMIEAAMRHVAAAGPDGRASRGETSADEVRAAS